MDVFDSLHLELLWAYAPLVEHLHVAVPLVETVHHVHPLYDRTDLVFPWHFANSAVPEGNE